METTEKKISHTPGPWKVVYESDGMPEMGGGLEQYTTVFSDAGFGAIAHVLYKWTNILGDSRKLQQKTFEANAKLIAAAPELLEACIALLKRNRQLYAMVEYPHEDMAGETSLKLAESAIKKAT